MKALLLCLTLFFTSCQSLGAFDVPCAEVEMMKMKITYMVPQNATPEEAAKAIAERLSWPDLLRPHPDAPVSIKSRFEEIKAMVIQIKEGKPINKVEPAPTVQIAYASRTRDIRPTPLVTGITPMGNLHTSCSIPLTMVDEPTSIEEVIVYKDEPEDRQNCSLLAFQGGDGPGHFDGGEFDLQDISSVTMVSNTIVAKVPAVERVADPLLENQIRGSRMPIILKDTILRTQHMVEESSNLLTTKSSVILRIPAPSLGFVYVLFLLTILANFCGSYISPRSFSFARIKG